MVWAFFGLMLFMTYQQWVADYTPQPGDAAPQAVDEQNRDDDLNAPALLPGQPATRDSGAPL